MNSTEQKQQTAGQQWDKGPAEKLAAVQERANLKWETKVRTDAPAAYPVARVFTGCSY